MNNDWIYPGSLALVVLSSGGFFWRLYGGIRKQTAQAELLLTERNELQQSQAELQKQLEAAETISYNHREEVLSLHGKIHHLEKDLGQAQQQLSEKNQDNSHLQQKLGQQQQQVESWRSQFHQLEQFHEQLKQDHQKQLQELTKEKESLALSRQEEISQLANLRNQVLSLEKVRKNQETSLQKLQTLEQGQQAWETEKADLVSQWQSRLAQTEQLLTEEQERRQGWQADHQLAMEELQVAQDQIQSLIHELQVAQEQIQALTQELQTAQDQIQSLTQQLQQAEEAGQTVQKLQADYQQATQHIEQLASDRQTLSQQLQTLEAQNQKLAAEVAQNDQDRERLFQELTQLKAGSDHINADFAQLQTTHQQLDALYQGTIQQLENINHTYRTQSQALQQAIARIQELEAQLAAQATVAEPVPETVTPPEPPQSQVSPAEVTVTETALKESETVESETLGESVPEPEAEVNTEPVPLAAGVETVKTLESESTELQTASPVAPVLAEPVEVKETLTPTPALASPEPTEAESPALVDTSEPQPSVEATKPAKKSGKPSKSGGSPSPASPSSADVSLVGKRWIILGTLSLVSRDRVKELITASGGVITSSPSGKTDYAIVGKAPGEKLKKAQKLGIAQLSETQFLKLLGVES